MANMVNVAISQETYDALLAWLKREDVPEDRLPYFIERTLQRRLWDEARMERYSEKGKDELNEDQLMDIINHAIYFVRDTKLVTK